MASNVLKLHIPSFKVTTPSPLPSVPHHRTLLPTLAFPGIQTNHGVSACLSGLRKGPRLLSLSARCSLSTSTTTPPTSKVEAIQQAKASMETALKKTLNGLMQDGKKLKQRRFQVEVPLADNSLAASPFQLALDVFGGLDISVKRKSAPQAKTVILWPNTTTRNRAAEAFQSHSLSSNIEHAALGTAARGENGVLGSADVAVFFSPEGGQLPDIMAVCDSFSPKPVVMFNPVWAIDPEANLRKFAKFTRSFEVIYSFTGLEVQGVLSTKRGMVFKGTGKKWDIFVEDQEGELKVMSTFEERPSLQDVEDVLYNALGMNSPFAKSAKFFKELISNVTGRK